jgi:aminocarboxymuconate-semialdehyde decarboxylase
MTHGHAAVIDVHCHVVPAELPADPTGGRLALWPSMCCDGGHATFTAGPTTRRFDERSWLASRRIDHMDRHGIGMQVLSPLPELFAYWFEPAATALMCRHVNDTLARMVEAHPQRFAALGGLPMNDPALAIAEARRLKAAGFVGVEIGSNVNGVSPADARHAEVLAALHELDLSVFVHGVRPETGGRLLGPDVLAPIVGIPMDTALCVASFIGTGVLDRLPRLRVAFSHGGGALGAVIDRFEHVWTVMPELQQALPRSPLAEARRYWYDVLTFGSDYTRFLIGRLGSDRLFVGTDFPAGGMGLMDPAAFIAGLGLDTEALDRIARLNARDFLGL